MSECYKCGATEGLSKRGKTVLICKPCRREEYRRYKQKKPVERKLAAPIERKPVQAILPKCFRCGTTKDVEQNQRIVSTKKYQCFKCSIKLRYKLILPNPPASKQWMEMAEASKRLILERRT